MEPALKSLLDLLDLEDLEVNLFRGQSPQDGWQRVFGGQVLGQALVAAYRTVEDRDVHSLHAYFLRPGDITVPIIYEVDRIRDGRSFTTRRVSAIQRGRPIFHMEVSFQIQEPGLEHQFEMPEAPPPDGLPSWWDRIEAVIDRWPKRLQHMLKRDRPIEQRFVTRQDLLTNEKMPPHQMVWFRAIDKLPDDIHLHQCVLAYASDMTLLDTSTLPHGLSAGNESLQVASLDHTMWVHRPFRADEWLLYVQESPSASGARGFNTGRVFTRDGVLIASVAQEGLIRQIERKKKS